MNKATGPLSPAEAARDQRHPGLVELRGAHPGADALGEPGHEVFLLVGAHLHGMAHFGRIGSVRDRGTARHHRALG